MAGKVDGFNLRVLSYNVLAQNLLHGHTYLYRNSPAYALKWEYRWEGIRSEVDDLNPDVVCLQEVQMEDPPYFDLALLLSTWVQACIKEKDRGQEGWMCHFLQGG